MSAPATPAEPEPASKARRDLHHAKLAMRRHILTALYAPFQQRFTEGVAALVASNTEIGKFSHAGFAFAGKRYGELWSPRSRIPLPRLLPELTPEMQALVREQRYIDQTEYRYIEAALSALLARSATVYQFRDLLPETLHRVVKEAPSTCWWSAEFLSAPTVKGQAPIVEQGMQLLRERLVKNLIDL